MTDVAKELSQLLLKQPTNLPVNMVMGVVSSVSPRNTVEIYLSGGTYPIGGVRYLDSYEPQVNDTVIMLKHGPDLLIVGKTEPKLDALEAVRVVGVAGEPAFQNAWTNFAGGFQGASFWRDPYGIVHVQGLVAGGTTTGTIFTLPEGYRPQRDMRYPALANGVKVSVYVFTDGVVRMTATGATSNAWCSLSGIEFRAEGVWPENLGDWLAVQDVPGNTWTDDVGQDPPQWTGAWRRPDGLWYARGFLSGSASGNLKVFPPLSAPEWKIMPNSLGFTAPTTGHVHERVDIARTVGTYIELLGGTSVRLSLDNFIWPEAALWAEMLDLTSLLVNAWVPYKSVGSVKEWGGPAIYKDPWGQCYMTGLIRSGSTATNSVVLTLPVGYRPAQRHIYAIRNSAGSARLTVQENGAVLIGTGGDGAANGFMSLDGIRFLAEN